MIEGLLWFDNTPERKLDEKIRAAAARYQVRLSRKPTVCYVNSDEFCAELNSVGSITVKPAAYIRPHHFWLGVETEVLPAKQR